MSYVILEPSFPASLKEPYTPTIPSRTVPRSQKIGNFKNIITYNEDVIPGPYNILFDFPNIGEEYKYSANLMQTIVAFIEALIFTGGKMPVKVFYAAIIFISTFVPPSGLIGYFGPNEKLMETLVATVLTSFLITPVYGGSYSKNAMIGFMLSTSSAGFTSASYSYFYA